MTQSWTSDVCLLDVTVVAIVTAVDIDFPLAWCISSLEEMHLFSLDIFCLLATLLRQYL